MKKRLLLLAFILPLGLFAQVQTSQEFKLEVSEPFQVIDGTGKYYFTNGDKMMSIKMSGDINFQLFDATSMKEVSRTQILKKTDLPKGFVHEEFLQRGNEVVEFYNVWDKENKTEQIFCKTFTFDNLGQAKDDKLLFTSGKLKSQMGANKINLYQSFDKEITLIVYEEYSDEKKDDLNFQTFGMVAFDKGMNQLWKKDVKMPYSEAEIENMGYTVDKNGVAYLLLRQKNEEAKNALEIMRVNGDDVKTIKVDAGGRYFPKGVKLQEGKNGKLYCAGYYGGRVNVEGIYIAIMGDGGMENEKFHQIPLEVINQYKNDEDQEKNKEKALEGEPVGIKSLGLDQIVVHDDGSLTLVGEVFACYTFALGLSSATNTYSYREVVLAKVDVDGNPLWIKKLIKDQKRKQQYDGNYGSGLVQARLAATKYPLYDLSYKYINKEGNHYVLFLDNVKNMTIAENEYPATHSSGLGGYVTVYQVDDKTGAIKKLSLFDTKDVQGMKMKQFAVDRIVELDEKTLLVELYKKGKEDVVLKVTIED